MSTQVAWLVWTVVTPLGGALLALVAGRRADRVALVALAVHLVAAVAVARQVVVDGCIEHFAGGWAAPLGVRLRADGPAALMLVAIAVVGGLAAAYAQHYVVPRGRAGDPFWPLWLGAIAGLSAMALSGDLFNLYVTLELTTLAAVSLVILDANRATLAAGLRYLLTALLGSLGYLLGAALLYGAYGTLDMALLGDRIEAGTVTWVALVLITVGLCLKAALFPLHTWLPAAHAGAPAPVSALLSALVVKGAWYVLLRLWTEVFGSVVVPGAGTLIGVLGGIGVVWGSWVALHQQRLKLLIAYSTVAQIGYLFLVLPLGTGTARTAGLFLVVAHAAAKASMFLAAGCVQRAVGHDLLADLQGMAQRLPATCFAFGLAGVSLIGIPPSGGFVAKWLLVGESLATGQWWWALVILGGGLLAALYVFRVVRLLFLPLPAGVQVAPVPRVMELAALALALVALLLGVAPGPALELAEAGGR